MNPRHFSRRRVARIMGPGIYNISSGHWDVLFLESRFGQRTMHEIVLPPFKAAIQEAGALSVMRYFLSTNYTIYAIKIFIPNPV